jgi:hypothetical protein
MNFKIDENLPTELADRSQRPSSCRGRARLDRILFTLDNGIANIVRFPVDELADVVLFRPDTSGRRAVLSFVRTRLSELLQMELACRLTVVGPSRIRFR